MWLINTESLYLKEFSGDPTDFQFPKYAILSHTWEGQEVSFQEMQNPEAARKKNGYQKIVQCCEIAKNEGLRWAWVDTCCIDKTSSAELSEAINSMFKWYEAATICYAYMSDIPYSFQTAWTASRWFERGWTLQELVAPFEVVFYDRLWNQLGTKRRLTKMLEAVTNIPAEVLLDPSSRRKSSVAARMSWAKGRQTTRKEDRAYSLLGLFDINMPLLYGEGDKAFSRLHEGILNSIQDDSIFFGGLAFVDRELSGWPMVQAHDQVAAGFLVTPESTPTKLAAKALSSHITAGAWPYKDSRTMGNLLSMSLKIIQVRFPGHARGHVSMTLKRQIEINLDRTSQEAIQDICDLNTVQRLYGMKFDHQSLCLGTTRCGTKEDLLVARYFRCYSVSEQIWAFPTSVYRFVSSMDVSYWPDMQCHIPLHENCWRPLLSLNKMRDPWTWESAPWRVGPYGNGWVWRAVEPRGVDFEQLSNFDSLDTNGRMTVHTYRLVNEQNSNALDLTIALSINQDNLSQEFRTVVELKLTNFIPSGPDIQTVRAEHNKREGPVAELYSRLQVKRGFADLVVTIYYGVSGLLGVYTPMLRFRAFEADGT
ncbi:heterokaryon incompatibility protein-domain-containing protein [Xylariaceae sp. FL1651]|nr:heterokaryon incompatibility protein-domain-containing protein [Xylariaceae sp. FL1651]